MNRLLAIGANAQKVAEELFADDDGVVDMQIDTAKLKPSKKQAQLGYDYVVSFMSLASVDWYKVSQTCKVFHDAVKPGGEIHVFAPSLEWVVQVMSTEPNNVVLPHMYGTQADPRRSIFTIPEIRGLLTNAGFEVRDARMMAYQIEEEFCGMIYVRAVRPDRKVEKLEDRSDD